MSDQFVYFIQADEDGPIKIGFTSDDPKRRLSQLQTSNASKLKLLGAIKGTTTQERQFHATLAEWRLEGEWFESHPTVLETIQEALSVDTAPIHCGGPHCSFCGCCTHDTTLLIRGLGEVHICGECSVRCVKVAAEQFAKNVNAALPIPLAEMGYGG